MAALLDPTVYRDADAYLGHLIAVLDSEEHEVDEFWVGDHSSCGEGAPRGGEGHTQSRTTLHGAEHKENCDLWISVDSVWIRICIYLKTKGFGRLAS